MHGERGLIGWLTWEGCCYGFLAAARCVSGTKEIRRKKTITLYLLARHIFHAFAGAEGSSERRKKVTPYIYC